MRCIRPLKANLRKDGSVTFSSKDAIPGLVPFEIECRKCLPCRLNGAREKAIRAVHEAQIHEDNIFLTLTYAPQHLTSPRLVYADWQGFMKRLRSHIDEKTHCQQKISCMVTGEYGEINKRPHWHALIFNFRPDDQKPLRETPRGDHVYESETLQRLWPFGISEYGDVTIDSANYTARYAAKKLVHGDDTEHDYHPIHRTSSKHAIGKRWIEKNYRHVLENGFVVLPNGQTSKIPRYYVDWAKKYQPDLWLYYVTQVRPLIQKKAEAQSDKEWADYLEDVRAAIGKKPRPLTRSKVKETILKSKFKVLQENLKL